MSLLQFSSAKTLSDPAGLCKGDILFLRLEDSSDVLLIDFVLLCGNKLRGVSYDVGYVQFRYVGAS